MPPATANDASASILRVRQQTQQNLPSCVRPCLDFFKNSAYSCESDDLPCFCSRYSSQGLTLGELAYGCSNYNCKDVPNVDNRALYSICSGEKAAVSATQTRITLPPYPSSSHSATATRIQSTPASSVPVTTTTSEAAPASITSASTSTSASATGSPPVPADNGSGPSTNLTSGQAVGVSIGAMGGLCLAGALLWFILWCRRRRTFKSPKSRKDSFDFIDKGAPRHSPFRYGYADSRGTLGGFAKPRVEQEEGAAQDGDWYEQQSKRAGPGQHDASLSRGIRAVSPASRSYDSLRTRSQLLPDKAGQTPPQPQYKPPRAASVFSTATVFEEDGKTPKLLSPATMLPMPVAPKPVLKTLPRRPERPTYSAIFSTSPVEMRHPQSISSSPTKSVRKELTPSPLRHIPPAPPVPAKPSAASSRALSTEFRVSTYQHLQPPSSVPSYVPEYYASSDSRSPAFDIIAPPRRRPVPTPSKPPARSAVPPKSYRCSGGSETSFESTDPDEITPPEEIERHLSPVPEGDSPSHNIKYPKVPRSSNQAVPRSPKPALSPSYQHSPVWPLKTATPPPPAKPSTPTPKTPPNHQPSLSGSTLAAKRLGSSAANTLTNGLHIRSNSNAQSSPLKGYGRTANSNSVRGARGGRPPILQQRKPSYAGTGYGPDPEYEDALPRTPEMMSPGPKILRTDREIVLRSPLWEPKLTPSRRGEDLFLSVSLASPGFGPGHAGAGGMDFGRP